MIELKGFEFGYKYLFFRKKAAHGSVGAVSDSRQAARGVHSVESRQQHHPCQWATSKNHIKVELRATDFVLSISIRQSW